MRSYTGCQAIFNGRKAWCRCREDLSCQRPGELESGPKYHDTLMHLTRRAGAAGIPGQAAAACGSVGGVGASEAGTTAHTQHKLDRLDELDEQSRHVPEGKDGQLLALGTGLIDTASRAGRSAILSKALSSRCFHHLLEKRLPSSNEQCSTHWHPSLGARCRATSRLKPRLSVAHWASPAQQDTSRRVMTRPHAAVSHLFCIPP